MIALQITDIGFFMNNLLRDGLFDHFLLREASVTQAVSHTIDGSIRPDYYDSGEAEALGLTGLDYMPFGLLRPICFELMKGKKKPSGFKFVFQLSPVNQRSTVEKSGAGFHPEDVSAMYINLVYKNSSLLCTTGISYRIFSRNRALDREWDRMVMLFLRQHGVAFEQAG